MVILLSVAVSVSFSIFGFYNVVQKSESTLSVARHLDNLAEWQYDVAWKAVGQSQAPRTIAMLQNSAVGWQNDVAGIRSTSLWTAELGSDLSLYRVDMTTVSSDLVAGNTGAARKMLENGAWKEMEAVRALVGASAAGLGARSQHATQAAEVEVLFMAFFITLVLSVLFKRFNTARVQALLSAAEARSRAESKFRSLVNNSSDILAIVDAKFKVLFTAPSWQRIMGKQEVDVTGRNMIDFIVAEDKILFATALSTAVSEPSSEFLTRWIHADGTQRWMTSTATNLLDDPAVAAIVVNSRDVTEQRQLEEQLVRNVFYDSLTGIANRVLLHERLSGALRRASLGSLPSLVCINLNDFKSVNESYSHDVGDELIQSVAHRLEAKASNVDTVARLSGDEFAILIESGIDPKTFSAELLFELTRPFELSVGEVLVRASIGAVIATTESTADGLLRDADVAMYVVKRSGKVDFALFDPSMYESIRERIELKNDLTLAIERDEFIVMYQPVVVLSTAEIIGVEALVRWQHPTRGLIPPLSFIPIAEESRAIVQIGRSVLRKATFKIAELNRSRLRSKLSLNVNLSVIELEEPDVCDFVRRTLSESGFDPELLVIELTETVLMTDPAAFAPKLKRLHDLGIRIAIDDFGTGYSSLSYLENFSVDTLKIDKSFTDHLLSDSSPVMLKTIIQLGLELGLKLVAEGIEEAIQATALIELGCKFGQGYYFARPLSEEDLEVMIAPKTKGSASGSQRLRTHRAELIKCVDNSLKNGVEGYPSCQDS